MEHLLHIYGPFVLLCALCLASSARGYTIANTYTCTTPGKISGIGCWYDDKGYVTGLAFEDDYGVKAPAMCNSRGEPDNYIALKPYEVITEIVACEGQSRGSGYSLIKFITDASSYGTEGYECGYGLSDYDPAMAKRYGEKYKYHGVTKEQLKMGKYAKVTANCKSITSGKVPRWFKQEQQKRHGERSYRSDTFTYKGKTFEKASNIDPSTGRECTFCGPQGYYYSQVYPLAHLEARCGADGRLARLESACWNQEYRPAPNLVVLAVTFESQKGCSGCERCPDDKKSDYMRSLVAHIVADQVDQYRIDAKVKAGIIECKPAVSSYSVHNTTLSVAVTISVHRQEKDEVLEVLHTLMQVCSRNLCNCLPTGESCSSFSVSNIHVDFIPNLPRGVLVEYPSEGFMNSYFGYKAASQAGQAAAAINQQAQSVRAQVST